MKTACFPPLPLLYFLLFTLYGYILGPVRALLVPFPTNRSAASYICIQSGC
uniref:Uncharacterized protein n=1 Tax=Anguilla anguilla TaxID=7936 RepID=A0A0E9RFZ9_ANGAN